jgi:hypothetical protein
MLRVFGPRHLSNCVAIDTLELRNNLDTLEIRNSLGRSPKRKHESDDQPLAGRVTNELRESCCVPEAGCLKWLIECHSLHLRL